MRIIISKYAGFCAGVKRSIAIAMEQLSCVKGKIYTDGPLVHNANVVNKLAFSGIDQLEEGTALQKDDCVIIRAHGTTPSRRYWLKSMGCKIVDATCPRVLKIASLVKKYSDDGCEIILVGDRNHPEIVGLCEYSDGGKIRIIASIDELKVPEKISTKVAVLCQTTFDEADFRKIVEGIHNFHKNVIVKNTICQSTLNRQSEIDNLIYAGCELIIVVGSKHSKNTNTLASVIRKKGSLPIVVESTDSISAEQVHNHTTIGIVSGASASIDDVYATRDKILSLISE